jgi:hypothetical protein
VCASSKGTGDFIVKPILSMAQKAKSWLSRLIPARGIIRSAAEWAEANDGARTMMDRGWHHWTLPVRDRELVELPPAEPIDGIPHPVFEGGRLYRYPPLSVTHVRGGFLVGREGVVLSPDGRVFEEFTFGWGPGGRALPRVPRWGLAEIKDRTDELTTILSPSSASPNYFHWLLDVLPRIAVMEQSGLQYYRLLVPAEMRPWQKDSLDALGYKEDRRVGFDGGRWRVESLLVPSLMGFSGMSRPWAVNWLRERLQCKPDKKAGARIYISRAHAGFRRVQNDEAVRGLLEKNGFQTVYTEDLTFSEQRRLFSNAAWVVSMHGAGLTNILFAPTACRVLEFMSPADDQVNTCYYALSAACGHSYQYLMGRIAGFTNQAGSPSGRWRQDLEIPIEQLAKALHV